MQPISSQLYNDRFTQLIMCSATFPQYAIEGLQDVIDVCLNIITILLF